MKHCKPYSYIVIIWKLTSSKELVFNFSHERLGAFFWTKQILNGHIVSENITPTVFSLSKSEFRNVDAVTFPTNQIQFVVKAGM